MTGRYPYNHGDGRYAPRDRSPPHRFSGRRSPPPYGVTAGSRPGDQDARPPGNTTGNAASPSSASGRDVQLREPPRGPKALVDPGRAPAMGPANFAPAGPRGRRFQGRGDDRDREFRDARPPRDSPSFRGDRDRDRAGWRDRDRELDRRPSPPRARSPPARELRDGRELPRELEIVRGRRGSRDGPLSAGSSSSDPSAGGSGPFGRGGFGRGRGRGESEYRGRGRGIYGDDRDRLHHRSRSPRDRRPEREREDRDRERDIDRRDDGREDSRKMDREEREREAERYKRERLSGASDQRVPSGSLTNPPTPHSSSATSPHPPSSDGRTTGDGTRDAFPGRRPSAVAPSGNDARREGDKGDYFAARAEASRDRYGPLTASPPPQAPQVPAFGSFSHRATSVTGPSSNVWRAPTSPTTLSSPTTGPNAQTQMAAAPSGPRALPSSGPPIAPKAERLSERMGSTGFTDAGSVKPDEAMDLSNSPLQRHPPSNPSALTRPVGDTVPTGSQHLATSLDPSTPSADRSRAMHAGPQASTPRPSSSSSSRPFGTSPLAQADPGASFGPTKSPSLPVAPRGVDFDRVSKNPPFSPTTGLGVNIPTGPRADRAGRGRSNQWIRGGLSYPGGRGSASHAPGTKRDHPVLERERAIGLGRGTSRSDVLFRGSSPTKGADPLARAPPGTRTASSSVSVKDEICSPHLAKDAPDAIETVPMTGAASPPAMSMDSPGNPSFESGLSDDDDELNLEETLEDEGVGWARRISELQERLVESAQGFATICDQMPGAPTILPDKETRAVIAAETQYLQATAGGEVPALPTPKEDGAEDTTTADDEFTRDDLPLARNKTPPIDSLPFLTNGPPTPVSFVDLDVIQENLDRHQTIKSSLIRAVTKQRLSVADKQEELRRTYAALYRKWRIYADGLDREAERKKIETAEPEQPAAPPEASPPAQPPASVEGRRGGKFSTELELQRILKESELAAKEAQEKADREAREAKARVDTEKEAIVPDMLDEPQRDASVFRDSNQLLDGHQALSVFRFVHPPVDFDEEEQRIFTENFLLYPKKWGKIAEAIPNRSYQECIEHYYQTKHIAKYKQKLNKRRSNKKGRKPAPSTARPKSNALMSDLGVRPELYDGDEFDTPPAAVTDSGRPRRAAAPVFGELNSEVDSNASTQAPGRKPAVTPKGDGPAENPLERGTKRGKAGATREKGAKRGRNQLLAAAPGPSPEKSTGKAKERETGRDRDQKGDDDQKIKDVDDGRSLANIQARAASLEVPPNPQDDRSGVPASSSGSPQRETSRPSRGNHRAGAQTSSYWSVPESTDFPKLLDHFGSDWQAIASHMTSKTPVMVKNFFNREVQHGREELRERADAADERRVRGEMTGPPPVPSVLPKKRYDPPPATMQQPLAPRLDGAENNENTPRTHASSSSTATHLTPPQQAPAPRYPALAQAGTVQAAPQPLRATTNLEPRVSSGSQHQTVKSRASQHPPGPRAGFFPDTRPERPILQAQQQPLQQQSPQPSQAQHPPRQQNPSQHFQPPQLQQPQKAQVQAQQPPQQQYQGQVMQPQQQGSSRHPIQARDSSGLGATRAPLQPSSTRTSTSVTQSRSNGLAPPPEPRPDVSASKHQPQQTRQQQQALPHQPHVQTQPQPQMAMRRGVDVYGQVAYPGSPPLSQAPERLGAASPPMRSQPRPKIPPSQGYPAQTTRAPPPPPPPGQARQTETARKTSNIMDLLNSNEPEEPRPRKRARADITEQASQVAQPSLYHTQQQAQQQAQPQPQPTPAPPRREMQPEPQPSRQSYHRTASGERFSLGNQASLGQPSPRSVQEMGGGQAVISPSSSGWQSRQYGGQASSPQPQGPYGPHSRPAYPPPHTAPPSPPYSHGHSHNHGHSRGPSYSDRQASLLSQQQAQRHHASPGPQGHPFAPPHGPSPAQHGHHGAPMTSHQQPLAPQQAHQRHQSQASGQLRPPPAPQHQQAPPQQVLQGYGAPPPPTQQQGPSPPHPGQMQHQHPPQRSYTPGQYRPYEPPSRPYDGHERR